MKRIMVFVCALLFTQIYGQSETDKKELRVEKAKTEYARTKMLVNSENFVFTADRAIPMGGGRISLITIHNQIKFSEGIADIVLPYFGTVWGGGGYNHQPGINFSGKVSDYEVILNDQKQRIQLKFDLKNGTEIHNVVLTIRRRGYTSVLVKSSGRSSITYDGYTRALPDTN